jgi:hypothetical protein
VRLARGVADPVAALGYVVETGADAGALGDGVAPDEQAATVANDMANRAPD